MSAVGLGEEIDLFVHQLPLFPFLAERRCLLALTSSNAGGGFTLSCV